MFDKFRPLTTKVQATMAVRAVRRLKRGPDVQNLLCLCIREADLGIALQQVMVFLSPRDVITASAGASRQYCSYMHDLVKPRSPNSL